MNPAKAIETLNLELIAYPHTGSEDWYNAVQLGIESLERHQERSNRFPNLSHLRLPSETEE